MTQPSTLNIPPTQNTAPVFEFRCLYTHDLRQKKKRWQDGYLRFHTFNRRIMVYDAVRNFIGDLHWQDTSELQDGDEVTLDKGVIVQVGESMGTLQTDLTPLLERKHKSQQTDAPHAAAPKPLPPKVGTQLKHKSLNTLLSTSRGPIGKAALPVLSPFEIRHQKENDFPDERDAKRQRTEQSPAPWGIVKTTKLGKTHSQPLWAKTSVSQRSRTPVSKNGAALTGQSRMQVKEVIDLLSDQDEHPMSDMTIPDDISPQKSTIEPVVRARAMPKRPVRPALAVRKELMRTKQAVPVVLEEKRVDPSSPPVSVANSVVNVEEVLEQLPPREPACKPGKRAVSDNTTTSASETQGKRKTKPLKISVGKVKKTLMCEEMSRPSKSRPKPNVQSSSPLESSGAPPAERPHPVPTNRTRGKTPADTIAIGSRQPTDQSRNNAVKEKQVDVEMLPAQSESRRTMTLDHGRMDQQFAPKPAPNAKAKGKQRVAITQNTEHDADQIAALVALHEQEVGNVPGVAGNPTTTTKATTKSRTTTKAAASSNAKQAKTTKAIPAGSTSVVTKKGVVDKAEAEPPADKPDLGPWSREAFDLFDWRPPDAALMAKAK